MKRQIHINMLFVKILCTVIVGITCLSVALSTLNLFISKKVFVNNFSESQRKIFKQIDKEFYKFFSDVIEITSKANMSWAVREYLTTQNQTDEEEMKTIYYMQKHMKETKVDEHSELGVMLMGMNGKNYILNNARKDISAEAILQSEVAKKAMSNPGKLICEYEEKGYTDDQKNVPVLVMAKSLNYSEKDVCDGIIFISIKESEFQKMYDYFTSDTSDIIILNQNEKVISSNEREYLNGEGKKELEMILDQVDGEGKSLGKMYLTQKLQGTNFRMVGVTVLIGLFVFIFIKQQTRPLSKLADKMRLVQEGNMQEYVDVEGTEEIQELSKAYNTMLERINQYIEERMKIQEEKRNAEIHALQMQINPHYMYNTLASIKWLTWQGDVKKSTAVIDAFISLLRNTISNTDEFVTVEQEVANLKNYVLINQTRYGDAVGVEFYVVDKCKEYLVPKLILQPFVENAFFHAFPEGMEGEISVFIKEEKKYLRFDIEDNGVGMDAEQLYTLNNKKDKKSEHFTGIGINNVDDRIKLIYGMDYGINIVSEKDKGTTITILLPRKEKEHGNSI